MTVAVDAGVVCPHCGNADPRMIDEEGGTRDWQVFWCEVCARVWWEPRKGEA